MNRFTPPLHALVLCALLVPVFQAQPAEAPSETRAELKDLSLNGGIADGKARLTIEAALAGLATQPEKLLYATTLQDDIRVSADKLRHEFAITLDVLQGRPNELALTISGDGEIRNVTGEGLLDWSVRRETNQTRLLILRPRPTGPSTTQLTVRVTAEQPLPSPLQSPGVSEAVNAFTLTPAHPSLFNGYVRIAAAPEWNVQVQHLTGLVPIKPRFLPDTLRPDVTEDTPEPLAFRFLGSAYRLPLDITSADPEARRVILHDFKLVGHLEDDTAAFTLTATARMKNPKGGTLTLLSGAVALSELAPSLDGQVLFEHGRFVLHVDHAGEIPIQVQFRAAVRHQDGWNGVDFQVAPATVQPLVLQGLGADTSFQFVGGARPERAGGEFLSYLPPNGAVRLSWKEARREAEGKLFYGAEMLSQISVSPGLMRQTALIEFKVVQGELNRIALALHGPGEVTRVQGDSVLAWNVEPVPNSANRRLVVQLNQSQKDQFSLQIQAQTPLGAFPQTSDVLHLRPENATRFAGYLRVLNDGAVRLEVTQATGLSQISPEQFPETDATRSLWSASGNQRFAYRFSGSAFALRVQADQILPEVSVSEVLAYRLAENETDIDAEMELDIREAPLRELLLHVPKGYALARVTVAGLGDYFLREPADQPDAELRLVYGQPVSGRQLVQLRLERNQALSATNWILPRIEVARAKSTRGHVGVAADEGLRLSAERTEGLTELATAFFPQKTPGLQLAFRLTDPVWQATIRVERLPQTVQVDALHLFSIGEGIAYGSSVLNYVVSGAPVSSFPIELSAEYFNVEFTGKDIRNWEKTTNGYVVHLHTPVSGPYTLLAAYERPFKAQGETLAFTGARPLSVQSEQGHTLVISAYQFQVQPVDVSPGLLPLEPGEVPPEYRLLFDAPILAAYRYSARPFNLRLALSPLVQGDSLSQVVDRALLQTRISKTGQVLTDAHYFVKNRGHPNFRLAMPEGMQLWSAIVNGKPVVPVADGPENLIPLPQQADPNALITVDLKLAARSPTAQRVAVATPVVAAPVMLAEWKVQPDTGQQLFYRSGSLVPAHGLADDSGFAGLIRLFTGVDAGPALLSLVAALALGGLATLVWRWTTAPGVVQPSARYAAGVALGVVAWSLVGLALATLFGLARREVIAIPPDLTFLAPVQQPQSALTIEVANLEARLSLGRFLSYAWPVLVALGLWGYAWLRRVPGSRTALYMLGWLLTAWAALRLPQGLVAFLSVMSAFLALQLILPMLRRLMNVRKNESRTIPPAAASSAATATLVLLLSAGLGNRGWGTGRTVEAAEPPAAPKAPVTTPPAGLWSTTEMPKAIDREPALAESVVQQVRVEDQYAIGTVRIRWRAEKGRMLPVLYAPAVLTHIDYPTNALRLVEVPLRDKPARQLIASENGLFELDLQYEVPIEHKDGGDGFNLPTQPGLINQVDLTLVNLDVDIASPQAVSVERRSASTNSVASLVLAPANDAWIGWTPRRRDVRREKPVFYAEMAQLYVPSPGVVEGIHSVSIRPAQGELSELLFKVPAATTITDVVDPARLNAAAEAKSGRASSATPALMTPWRFDPDTRQLRVTLTPAQSKPFVLIVRSQVATGPLPFAAEVGLLSVDNAAAQIGLLGIATGNEVQLDTATTQALSPINLEDFPAAALQPMQSQIPGLTLRRAFRYADPAATATLRASAVEPDVRVENQMTLSLGEDRNVLAASFSVAITRAGIFQLSFPLPAGFDLESISGSALSHWTELRTGTNRIITLHLRGKTEGNQQFAVSLAGPGVKAGKSWPVPRLALREATKQQGTLLVVPEQGIRLQAAARSALTQLDPQKSGIAQKGVLAFRILQDPWSLALDLEQVDPWIQVNSLQHASINEALVKVTANLQFQIENAGLKTLRVLVATNAENVRFTGDQVADFRPLPDGGTNNLRLWEIKLHRRVLGSYLLQVHYQTLLQERASATTLDGVRALDANLQRGFVTVESAGRLQVRADPLPAALQPTEWQRIPRVLQQDLETASANLACRLVEPSFELPLRIERHEATRLLPARVNQVTLRSAVSDEGVMLTQVHIDLLPGDKRLLDLTLPQGAQFWFAFVDQNGVWPWREQDRILIPLEQQARDAKPIPVEFFYSSQVGKAGRQALDLELVAPKFDLPLENITWQVYLSDKWQLKRWTGSLQMEEQQAAPEPVAVDLQAYLRNEATVQREKTKEAEQMLAAGNSALERGDQRVARRAFQAAFGLSQGDNAFNEDARVQLNNLKIQQALVGLNVRQAAVANDADALATKLGQFRTGKEVNYTQKDAQAIIDRNTSDDNAALMRLAQRLIQQQEAAVSSPAAIRTSIPTEGRLLTFKRAVLVDTWSDLHVHLIAGAARGASWSAHVLILTGTALFLVLGLWGARHHKSFSKTP